MPTLNQQILIGVVLGVITGFLVTQLGDLSPTKHWVLYGSTLTANIFVDLLKMVLIPLIFSTIVVGIANLKAHKQVHTVWKATLIYFVATVSIALTIGLLAMNIFQPGQGLHLSMFQDAMTNFEQQKLSPSEFFLNFFHSLFQNPFSALADGKILAVVIFALFLGIALVVGGDRYNNILRLFQEFLDLMMRIIGWIMYIAPYGIFALLVKLVASQNADLLSTLAGFVALVFGMIIFHGAVVLPLILYLFTKKSPLWLWRGSKEALITAFATSSSSATLPITLRCVENNLGVRKDVAGFVVPLGATLNMDGTALYEAAAALFVANLAGIDLSLSQQMIVFGTAMIASLGAPGIPSAGLVTMILVLQSVGLPIEAIAILLPIDRLLDTARTTVNVEGDIVGSLVVQKIVGNAQSD